MTHAEEDLIRLAQSCERASPNLSHHTAEVLLGALISSDPRTAYIASSLLISAGDDLGKRLGGAALAFVSADDARRPFLSQVEVDVLLLAIKKNELDGILHAFGLFGSAPRLVGSTGFAAWYFEYGGLSFAITMVSTAGNVEAASALFSLDAHLHFSTAVLVGMAAGVREEVNLGDVVVSETVWAYEFSRLTEDGAVFMAKPYRPSDAYLRSFSMLERSRVSWADDVVSAAAVIPDQHFPDSEDETLEQWTPRFHRGGILAGGKLLEDGSLPKRALDVHSRAVAAEMEGEGFANACEELGRPWAVFRGIADYGEPGRRQHWQVYATFAVASYIKMMVDERLLFQDTLFA